LLVLHGERDAIIDPSEGERAFAAAGPRNKEKMLIPGRDHNDLWLAPAYRDAVKRFVARTARPAPSRRRGRPSARYGGSIVTNASRSALPAMKIAPLWPTATAQPVPAAPLVTFFSQIGAPVGSSRAANP